MENMTKAELFQRKGSLKSKLMAALSLLLVSTIMLGSATFAWFTLSTAPEVADMSTTVGSNGSLEIALRDWDEESDEAIPITSNVGDSYSVTANWQKTNTTWGNIIDLSGAAYGLNGAADAITLYPARLNVTEADGVYTVNTASPLVAPQYGTDGRVATIGKTLSTGRYTADGYMAGQTGVRGIGEYTIDTSEEQTITAAEMAGRAKTRMDSVSSQVTTGIGSAVNTVLPYVATLGSSEEDYIAGGTGDRIVTFLETFKAQVENLQAAVGYAYLMEVMGEVDGSTPLTDTPGVILNTYGEMTATAVKAAATAGGNAYNAATALETIVANAGTAAANAAAAKETSGEHEGEYSVSDLKTAVTSVLAYNNLYAQDSGGTLQKLSSISTASDKMAALTNATAIFFYGDAGSFAQVAAITGKYSFYMTLASSTAYVTSVNYVEGTAYEAVDNAGYLAAETVTANTAVASRYTTNAGTGSTYGYALDLAFRTNAATGLVLSPATERVSGDGAQSEELIGGGSTVTSSDTTLLTSVYVAFINPTTGELYGIARANTAGALSMQEISIDADGVMTLTAADSQTIVGALTTNAQNNITAIVFLDGDAYDADGGAGTTVNVNLQFASTVPLTPMDYSGYLTYDGETTGGAAAPTYDATIAVGGTANLTASDAPDGATVTWSSSAEGVATVSSSGAVTGVAAGTATITASWDGGSQTFSVQVTAS